MKNLIIILFLFIISGCDLEYGAEYNTLNSPIPEWKPREFIRDGENGMVDFSIIYDGDLYHIIGINPCLNGSQWDPQNYDNNCGFVHATSPDLIEWTEHDPIVDPLQNGVNYIWAPDIMEINGIYHMWYTGVTLEDSIPSNNLQFIMHSTSEDLFNWSDPEIVFDGNDDPLDLIKWGEDGAWNNDFRDPDVFIFQITPLGNPIYGMTISVKEKSQNKMGIGLAVCGSDQGIPDNKWQLLTIYNETIGTGIGVESSQILNHNNHDYLFWTTWDYGVPEQIKISVDGNLMYSIDKKACEIIKDQDGNYIFAWLMSREEGNGFDIKIETLSFDENGQPWFQE